MRIGTQEIEVSTEPYQDGWRSYAFLTGGGTRASMTCDSREGAEIDLFKRLRDEFAPVPKFDPNKRYEAKDIVTEMLDEPGPEHYINRLPPVFRPGETLERIQAECAYCMDDPEDKENFMDWIRRNENLFPDVAKALAVIEKNDSWCTDELTDMTAFFEAIGFSFENTPCPRCEGTGDEPGAPIEDDGTRAICDWCGGSGRLLAHCECDNTHQANDTVCQWCYARGRRRFNDPAI